MYRYFRSLFLSWCCILWTSETITVNSIISMCNDLYINILILMTKKMSLYFFFALFLRKRQAVMNTWHYEIARNKRCSKGNLLVKTRIRIERQKVVRQSNRCYMAGVTLCGGAATTETHAAPRSVISHVNPLIGKNNVITQNLTKWIYLYW